ncbi:MAG TPA: SDR family oxidoreductase [Methylomirabilota bacterium]
MARLHLVTGGAGFIGSSLARALLARGDRVRIIDNFSSGKRENIADMARDLELVEGDILDDAAMARAIEGVEVVFHEAAIPSVPKSMAEPLANHAANATGTLNVLAWAKRAGVKRLVYAASSAAYGESPELPKIETMAPAPISPYGASKLAGESYCQVYAAAFGLETVCLRYFNVFGPRQDPKSEYAAVIPRFILWALEGTPLEVHGDGTQSRDFTYIDNVVDANLAAATAPAAAGEVFNVGCGNRVSLLSIIERIEKILGRPVARRHTPGRAGDVPHTQADVSKAERLMKYTARVDFDEGFRRTVDFFRRGA